MKFSLLIIFLVITSVLLISCQPKSIIKNEQKAMIDSSFYYVQDDMDDPFLDTIFQKPDPALTLRKEVYPPALQPERYKEIEGFRIQIFAGIDSLNALSSYTQAVTISTDSVYLIKDQGLIKVQVGDYPYRFQADAARDTYRRNGFPGAWVVQRSIMIAIDSVKAGADQPMQRKEDAQLQQDTTAAGTYKIQVIASGSEERAKEIAQLITEQLKYKTFYEKSGNLYKVFIGYFEQEDQARKALSAIRENGYPDAWLVY